MQAPTTFCTPDLQDAFLTYTTRLQRSWPAAGSEAKGLEGVSPCAAKAGEASIKHPTSASDSRVPSGLASRAFTRDAGNKKCKADPAGMAAARFPFRRYS